MKKASFCIILSECESCALALRQIFRKGVIGLEGFEQDAKGPRKQGLFDNADNTGTQFGTHSNYFEQILTLFDRLDEEEQKQILNMIVDIAIIRKVA